MIAGLKDDGTAGNAKVLKQAPAAESQIEASQYQLRCYLFFFSSLKRRTQHRVCQEHGDRAGPGTSIERSW